jgi:hypothetical protein
MTICSGWSVDTVGHYIRNLKQVQPKLEPVKEPSTGPKGVEKKDKRKRFQRGSNPRLKGNKREIKDNELANELKSGAVLLAYSSKDQTEPTSRLVKWSFK